MGKLYTILITLFLAITPFAPPHALAAEFNFFQDIRKGMPEESLKRLGAKPCAGGLCMDTMVGGKTWDGRYYIKNGHLNAVILEGTSTNSLGLDMAIKETHLIPVYVEIDGKTFEIAAELRAGKSPREAMQALMEFFQKAGSPSRMQSGYTDKATLDLLVKSGLSFAETYSVAPDAPIVLTLLFSKKMRVLCSTAAILHSPEILPFAKGEK